MNPITKRLQTLGQGLWLDNISRPCPPRCSSRRWRHRTPSTRCPEPPLNAFADHGRAGPTLAPDGGYAEAVLKEFRREGVEDGALAERLQREGAEAIASSWSALMQRISLKSAQPKA